MKYCITFKDWSASEQKFRWKKQNKLQILNYNYFVTKNPSHLNKDKSVSRNAIFIIKARFMQLICTGVQVGYVSNLQSKVCPRH